MSTPEQARRDAEEAMMAAQLAGGIAKSMTEIRSMSTTRTPIGKGKIVDPRQILRDAHIPVPGDPTARTGAPVNQRAPVAAGPSGDPLAPRLNMIPLPKGVNAQEIIPPEMRKSEGGNIPVAQSEFEMPNLPNVYTPVAQTPEKDQLELNFNRQATLNELYERLDSLQCEVKSLSYNIQQLTKLITSNANITSSTTTEPDKKKSDTASNAS